MPRRPYQEFEGKILITIKARAREAKAGDLGFYRRHARNAFEWLLGRICYQLKSDWKGYKGFNVKDVKIYKRTLEVKNISRKGG